MTNIIIHWVGAAVLLLILFFGISGLIDKYHQDILAGNAVQTKIQEQTIVESVLAALKDKNIASAITTGKVQLSPVQVPVSAALHSIGAGKLSAPLAAGLTQPHPQTQVLTVSTKADNKFEAKPVAEDTATEAAVRKVLTDPHTVLHTKVDTTVHVSYQDRPFSPVFSVYTARGSAGAGLTLRKGPGLDLDAILTSDPAVGVGVEHIFKGTSAGIGIGETYNFAQHRAQTEVYAAIHF